ncbi:Unknown protein sequence [Pseudomonas syringae pv. syringae]|nr:Unknown protein sequence [Pseudomonas syringae pv. syringae]
MDKAFSPRLGYVLFQDDVDSAAVVLYWDRIAHFFETHWRVG